MVFLFIFYSTLLKPLRARLFLTMRAAWAGDTSSSTEQYAPPPLALALEAAAKSIDIMGALL